MTPAMPSLPRILPADPACYPWRRRWLGTAGYWSAQTAFWGLLAAFLITSNLAESSRKVSAGEIWMSNLVAAVLGLSLTHLLRVVVIALRARAQSWRGFLGVLVPLNILTAAGFLGALLGLGALFSPESLVDESSPMTLVTYLDGVGFFFALFVVWCGFYLGSCYYRGYREGVIERLRLQAQVKEAELRTLKAQVNPHFLFNSLNTLRSMIPAELDRPRDAVTLLAELLRATLTLGDRATVSVAEELETVETYLSLEQLRFEQRLRVRARVDPAARALPVPPLLLQTLVENAVKFGVGTRREGGEVGYEIALVEDVLHLRVTNPGRLRTGSESTGLGLANARARLLHLFGPAASLVLAQADDDQVVAEVTIPVAAPTPLSA